jgi:hypothetical protein
LLGKLNAAKPIEELLQKQRNPIGTTGPTSQPSSLLSLWPFIMSCARRMATVIHILYSLLVDFCKLPFKMQTLLSTHVTDLSALCNVFFDSHLLKPDIQAIVKQLNIRLKQMIFFGDQICKLQQNHISPPNHAKPYIELVFLYVAQIILSALSILVFTMHYG